MGRVLPWTLFNSLVTSPSVSLLSDNTRTPANTSLLPTSPARDAALDACQNIYRMVCHKTGEARDLTGNVRSDIEAEKLALGIYKAIIQKHHDWTVEQIDEELVNDIFNPRRRGRIESAFHWVRHALEGLIERQPNTVFTDREKRQLKTRLRKTILQLPPPATIYADEPDLLTKNEAYYERTIDGQMRLRVGGAYVFVAKSWYNLIFTLGHELAHSIDPCEIRTAHLSFPAYDRLVGCFLQNKLMKTSPNRVECGANDKLSETFADWAATQVISEALKDIAQEFLPGQEVINAARNSVRDLCEQEEAGDQELDLEFHPTPKMRIEKIFGRNPDIRQLIGCGLPPDRVPYCSFEPFTPNRGSYGY
jgi:hypothetical protein